MSGRLVVLCMICAAAIAGCAVLRSLEPLEPAPWVPAGAPQPASDAESLLLYFQHIRKLSGADVGREHDAARQAYARARSDFNRLRLAMMLSLPGTAFTDEARALDLADAVAKQQGGRLQGLAVLLSAHLQEHKRLAANAQGLQQKLDALRSLEKSMIERSR